MSADAARGRGEQRFAVALGSDGDALDSRCALLLLALVPVVVVAAKVVLHDSRSVGQRSQLLLLREVLAVALLLCELRVERTLLAALLLLELLVLETTRARRISRVAAELLRLNALNAPVAQALFGQRERVGAAPAARHR